MSQRIVSLEIVDQVIEEKLEFYREWLGLGIIDEREMQERQATLDSIRRALFIHSRLPVLETNEPKEIA